MKARESSDDFDWKALRCLVGDNTKNKPYQSTYPIIRHWEEDKKPSVTGHEIVIKDSQSNKIKEEAKEQSFGI